MKKEIFAGVLLAVILLLALLNIHQLNRLTTDLVDRIETSEQYAMKGKWEEATKLAEEAADLWDQYDPYTHIVLRHAEIDTATANFYEFLKELYAENTGEARGAAEALKAHLTSILSIEQIKFGSIF